MSDQDPSSSETIDPSGVRRRQLSAALLALFAGGMGVAGTAHAGPRGAHGTLNAASRLLAPFGVTVDGDAGGDHPRLDFEIVPRPRIEYTQRVGPRNPRGDIEPFWATSVLGDDASATHFHPGEIVPCIRTRIEGHALATHELFDSDQGGIQPCIKVESEMLEGGHIGDVAFAHFHDGAIVPCVRTTIEGHARAVYELFDADEGGIIPCIKVASEMLDGGALGPVEVTIEDDVAAFRLVIAGGSAYRLIGGELVPDAR